MQNKKINIVMAVDTFYPVLGGVVSVVDQTATALSKYANITVVCVKAKGYSDPEKPYKILRCKGFYNSITGDGMAYPSLDKEFTDTIENMPIDVIHCHTAGNLMTYFLKVAKKRNIPLISTIHNTMYGDALHFVKLPFLAKIITKGFMRKTNKSDTIWAVSNYTKNYLLPFSLRNDSQIVYNAVSLTSSETASDRASIRKSLGLDPDCFIFTFVCRIIKTKNLDLLVDSVNIIKDQIPNYKVLLIGSGKYEKKLKARIKRLGLEKYFIMPGMIRNRDLIANYYRATDVVVVPSIIEASCLIHIEAAAFNVPSIVIENKAPAEKIVDNKNGFITKNNPADFAATMIEVYNNRDCLSTIGKKAHETIYRSYKDDNIVQELLENYKSAIKNYKNKKNK